MAEREHAVAAIASYDWMTYRRTRPKWPAGSVPPSLQREWWVQPPGYVGSLPWLFAPLLRWKLDRAQARLMRHAPAIDSTPCIIAPYPWFLECLRDVPDERLIYYNLDDYPLYYPSRTALIHRQEDAILRRAVLTLCLSQHQMETLRARVPADRAEHIRHFPLGVVESYLNPHPERVPTARTVGYIGNLIDRVDWRLVGETACALPDVEFVFVGSLEGSSGGGKRPDWLSERAAALDLPNVRRVGPIPQEDVPAHYWSFGVNWIPYATDHAFNRAACPTKIMDGLAAGRPMISTDLPECRLYPNWISIIHSTSEAVNTIRRLLTAVPRPEVSREQVAFARQNTWAQRANVLKSWLDALDMSARVVL